MVGPKQGQGRERSSPTKALVTVPPLPSAPEPPSPEQGPSDEARPSRKPATKSNASPLQGLQKSLGQQSPGEDVSTMRHAGAWRAVKLVTKDDMDLKGS
uniref:Uncharacterized protein n=1 Tax=Sphaerodactylus townsendi TaxID=933632 RepID=A0ACB8F5L5_9SAUR